MIKLSRALFILGIVFVVIGGISVYFTLTTGDKMLSSGFSAQSEKLQAQVDKAKAQIDDLKQHLPLRIAELALSLVAGVVGFIGTKIRKRGALFFALEAICLALTCLSFVSKSWFVAGLFTLGLVLSFIKIMKLTKNGAVIPEE
jgi:hypothetical protein